MVDTEVLFYIIIVVVIMVKLVFWCMYLCLKNRKLRRMRQRQNEAQSALASDPTCYEEVPAVPQPAFIFTGLVLPPHESALTECLPEYQADDPFKTDLPPPSYLDICSQAGNSSREMQSISDFALSDTQRLIDPSSDSNDG